MALEPCNVCGSLISSETEICPNCDSPTKGSKRPVVFRVAAIALVIVFALPVLVSIFGSFNTNKLENTQSFRSR